MMHTTNTRAEETTALTQHRFYRPPRFCDALKFVEEHSAGAAVIAGGTDILVAMRHARGRAGGPEWLVDISGLPEICGICESGGVVHIGAGTTHSSIVESPVIAGAAPLLAGAARTIGSVQIRNRATIGGNIMNASPAADLIPPLVALDAVAVLASTCGLREAALADLVTGPYAVSAGPGELLMEVKFAALPEDARCAFIKLGRRKAMAISRLSVACVLVMGNDGTVKEARISAGSAFPRPCRVKGAEDILRGQEYSAELAAEAGRAAAEAMVRAAGVRWSTDYKRPALASLVARAVTRCAEGEDEGE